MATNAQNAGRYDAYERLQSNGVDLTLEWAATLDDRTRHEHRMMHGQRRDVGEPFVVDGIEIMYPAQTGNFMGVRASDIPQSLIWGCRCTILAWVKGFEHDTIKESDKMGNMTFDEWLEAKENPQDILHQYETGKDIREDYIRRYAFPYEPGEGGAPDGGAPDDGGPSDNGWTGPVNGQDITGTWERRPDQFDFEIDDVIDAQGFDGKPRVMSRAEFEEAVKAANGGNGFIAQRAYTAPDKESLEMYHKELLDGKWYVDCSRGGAVYGQGMYGSANFSGKLSDQIRETMDIYKYGDVQQPGFADWQNHSEHANWTKILSGHGASDAEIKKYINGEPIDRKIYGKLDEAYNEYQNQWINSETERRRKESIHRVETFTLDPSAKIISYKDLLHERDFDPNEADIDIRNIGAYAAAKGYDAIRVDESDSPAPEVIILNRTKVIFLRED
jgi:hypothetical protein